MRPQGFGEHKRQQGSTQDFGSHRARAALGRAASGVGLGPVRGRAGAAASGALGGHITISTPFKDRSDVVGVPGRDMVSVVSKVAVLAEGSLPGGAANSAPGEAISGTVPGGAANSAPGKTMSTGTNT